jgi:hypothetical protein
MIPAVIEKVLWVTPLVVIHARGQMTTQDVASGAMPHGLLGVLFIVAYLMTPRENASPTPASV